MEPLTPESLGISDAGMARAMYLQWRNNSTADLRGAAEWVRMVGLDKGPPRLVVEDRQDGGRLVRLVKVEGPGSPQGFLWSGIDLGLDLALRQVHMFVFETGDQLCRALSFSYSTRFPGGLRRAERDLARLRERLDEVVQYVWMPAFLTALGRLLFEEELWIVTDLNGWKTVSFGLPYGAHPEAVPVQGGRPAHPLSPRAWQQSDRWFERCEQAVRTGIRPVVLSTKLSDLPPWDFKIYSRRELVELICKIWRQKHPEFRHDDVPGAIDMAAKDPEIVAHIDCLLEAGKVMKTL